MNVRRIGLITLVGIGGALGFGVLANACLGLVLPARERAAATSEPAMALASATSTPVQLPPVAKPEDLIGTTDIRPVKVKTIQMVLANPDPAPTAPVVTASTGPVVAATPRTRPAAPHDITAARPAPTAPAKRSAAEDSDALILSSGQIDRIKTALALTPDQEAYWPAVATELRAIAKQQPKRTKGGPAPKLSVDPDSAQRLYTAAAPLIMRLREDQKHTARELAMMLGLQEVAQAL